MEVSGSTGQQAWAAAMGKKEQALQGQQTLQLIQSATQQPMAQTPPKVDPSSPVGQNINITV